MRVAVYITFVLSIFVSATAYAYDKTRAEQLFLLGDWPAAITEYDAIASAEPSAENLTRLGEAFLYNLSFPSSERAFYASLKKAETIYARMNFMMLEALRDNANMPAFLALLDKYPQDARLWRMAGFLHVQMKQYNDALRYLNEAVRLDPADYMTHFLIGYSYEITNRYDDAIKAYKTCVDLNPNYAQAVNNLGYNYKERAYYSYAIEMYERAIALMPRNAGYYYNVGNAYKHKKMVKKAFYAYRSATDLDPTFAKAHYNLGRALAEFEFYEDSIPHLEMYIKHWTPAILPVDAPEPYKVEGIIETINDMINEREEDYQRQLDQ